MPLLKQFCFAAETAGAKVVACDSLSQAVAFIGQEAGESLLVPVSSSCARHQLADQLQAAGVKLATVKPDQAALATAGVTSACFAIADTGTLVLDSLAEDVRLASTLPPRHFVLLDKSKIVADGLAAVPPLRQIHQQNSRNYMAYITGPSRTADIERVLTIGVHGPKELFVLLLDNWSSDLLEM
jgi:L-lactate dehydrogenase complex protein LldG